MQFSHASHCCPARIDSPGCRGAVYSPAQANARPTLLLLANRKLRLGVLVSCHAPRTGRGRGSWELLRTPCSRWHQSESAGLVARAWSGLVPFPERSAGGSWRSSRAVGLLSSPAPSRHSGPLNQIGPVASIPGTYFHSLYTGTLKSCSAPTSVAKVAWLLPVPCPISRRALVGLPPC